MMKILATALVVFLPGADMLLCLLKARHVLCPLKINILKVRFSSFLLEQGSTVHLLATKHHGSGWLVTGFKNGENQISMYQCCLRILPEYQI